MQRLKRLAERGRPAFQRIREVYARYPYIRWAAGALIFGIVLWSYSTRAMSATQQLAAHWQPVSWARLGASFGLVVVCFVWAALAWSLGLRLLGGRLSAGRAVGIYFLSSLPRYVPGTVWGYLGRSHLCERMGVSYRFSMASTLAEVVLFVSTGVMMGLTQWLTPAYWAGASLVISLALAAGLTFLSRPAPAGFANSRQAVQVGLAWGGLVILYIMFWMIYGVSIIVLVGPEQVLGDLSQSLRIIAGFTTSWLAGFLAIFVPGGLGVREAGLTMVLEPLVGSAGAVQIALWSRVLNVAADLILFLLALPFGRSFLKAPRRETLG